MPSLDIVCRVDMHEIHNALNNAKKQLINRYDFRGSKFEIDIDDTNHKMKVVAEDKMKIQAIQEIFMQAAAGRKIDLKTFEWSEPEVGLAGAMKCEVTIRNGIEQLTAKKMVKMIKETKIKVQASIQGDEVRLTGKKIDDLHLVMDMLKNSSLGLPLQYVNMKR